MEGYMDEGFAMLKEKETKLLPILSRYEMHSILLAVFTINSWRNNRGSQESCLALNSAIIHNEHWGKETIDTYERLSAFFDDIYPILQPSHLDDPVMCDFGEIKLCFENKYYSVITGTGHTAPVFSNLQFLEPISEALSMHGMTVELLEYSQKMVDVLQRDNRWNDELTSYGVFELPTIEYFEACEKFFELKSWNQLNVSILGMMSNVSNVVVKTHFIVENGTYYPLFNPSLILDYFTTILKIVSDDVIADSVKNTLVRTIKRIYCSDEKYSDELIADAMLCINEKPFTLTRGSFAYWGKEKLLIFLDIKENDITEMSTEINSAFSTAKDFQVLDLSTRDKKGNCRGYMFDSTIRPAVILYSHEIDLDQTIIRLKQSGDLPVYSATDLMHMIMFSESMDVFAEFDNYRASDDSQITSWGGASDFYTIYVQEHGYISPGAIEYKNLYSGIDTAGSNILEYYKILNDVFPFDISPNVFAPPEQWIINTDDNKVNHFIPKSRKQIAGSVFVLGNGGAIFVSYDFSTLIQTEEGGQINQYLEFYRGLIERFIKTYHNDISSIDCLRNTLVELRCKSLSYQSTADTYAEIANVNDSSMRKIVSFNLDCSKIMKDIATVPDRTVEYNVILEILSPIISKNCDDFEKLNALIESDKSKKKTADTTQIEIPHYFNLDTFRIRENIASQLYVRKNIAIIASNNSITPGVYEQRAATGVVRKIQEDVVSYFEKHVVKYNRIELHCKLLSALACEMFSIKINDKSYDLCEDIDEDQKLDSQAKAMGASQDSKFNREALLYLIETNLFLDIARDEKPITDDKLSELFSFAHWLISLQNSSDLCYYTDSETKLIVLDDFRINVELGQTYQEKYDSVQRRTHNSDQFSIKGDEKDKEFFELAIKAFESDTGVRFDILAPLLRYLSEKNFSEKEVNCSEIASNVLSADANDIIRDFKSVLLVDSSEEEIIRALDFITIDSSKLKTLKGKPQPILPIWDKENRNERYLVKPLFKDGHKYIYSPIVLDETRKRWINGIMQFNLPYEIGLQSLIEVIKQWKERYEHIFSYDIKKWFEDKGFDYADNDIDIRRKDRKGNHPPINELGDYDVIALDRKSKTIYLIECKVLQPIRSIFEHSLEQKRFFNTEKFDEKFQKRINYFAGVFKSYFENLGYPLGDDEYKIVPLMVVNKVFDSYLKKVDFKIITFDELKKIVE